jgi:hypothetical protein
VDVSAALLASYLVNRPGGAPLVYLIAAAVVFGVAAIVAGWARDLWRTAIAAGLVGLVLALLTH